MTTFLFVMMILMWCLVLMNLIGTFATDGKNITNASIFTWLMLAFMWILSNNQYLLFAKERQINIAETQIEILQQIDILQKQLEE